MQPLRSGFAFAATALAIAFAGCHPDDEPADPRFIDASDNPRNPTENDAATSAETSTDSSIAPNEDGGACAGSVDCSKPRDLGSLSGDTGAGVKDATGTISEWLRVRLSEDDGAGVAKKVKARITLTSPAGTNYDLYAYVGPTLTDVQCSAANANSTQQAGITDVANVEFGETGISNGLDDARTVLIEVRWVSGACNGGSWTLKVEGNQ